MVSTLSMVDRSAQFHYNKTTQTTIQGMMSTMVKFKMAHFLFCSPDRKYHHFPALLFTRKGDSRDAQRNGVVKNGFTFGFVSQTGSSSNCRSLVDWSVPFSHFKRHHCFRLPEKPPSCENGTNQEEAGIYWRFLFGEGNRKWRHFGLHRCIQQIQKPLPVKMARINQKKARECWHFLFGTEKLQQTRHTPI